MKPDNVKKIVMKIELDDELKGWNVNYLSNQDGKKLLLKHLNFDIKINKIILHYDYIKGHSLNQWLNDLNHGKISMGLKSDDDFLKTYGYFKRVPIDRYYPPLLIRTGLLGDYIEQHDVDPGKFMGNLSNKPVYHAYTKLIKDNCQHSLQGVVVKQYRLSENPGIVDLYIWKHCASSNGAENICGNKPKCNKCVIMQYCNYGKKRLKFFTL